MEITLPFNFNVYNSNKMCQPHQAEMSKAPSINQWLFWFFFSIHITYLYLHIHHYI